MLPRIVKYFDLYSSIGLHPIPLYAGTKIPVGKKWNGPWNSDKNRSYFLENPDSNIGLLLGNIVDVEGDTEEANQLLNKLLGNYPHPMYQSSKSTHHLFVNPDPNLTAKRFSGIEFRANKHQSVLPPSIHKNGQKYFWLNPKFPVPPMPQKLLNFYLENKTSPKQPRLPKVKSGHIKTLCNGCEERVYLHRKRLFLEVKAFLELGLSWQCRECRTVDVREACRRIRNLTGPILHKDHPPSHKLSYSLCL